MGDYYSRTATLVEGMPSFCTIEDRGREDEVKAMIERAWKVELHRYGGHFSEIDWYAVRDGQPVANVELKSRSHASSLHKTVFLNLRKWIILMVAHAGTGLVPIYVVRFTDKVMWIDVRTVDAREIKMGGLKHRVKGQSDIEPVIEVPVASMRTLTTF